MIVQSRPRRSSVLRVLGYFGLCALVLVVVFIWFLRSESPSGTGGDHTYNLFGSARSANGPANAPPAPPPTSLAPAVSQSPSDLPTSYGVYVWNGGAWQELLTAKDRIYWEPIPADVRFCLFIHKGRKLNVKWIKLFRPKTREDMFVEGALSSAKGEWFDLKLEPRPSSDDLLLAQPRSPLAAGFYVLSVGTWDSWHGDRYGIQVP